MKVYYEEVPKHYDGEFPSITVRFKEGGILSKLFPRERSILEDKLDEAWKEIRDR